MTVAPILTRALRDGGVFAALVAVVAGAIGWFVAGTPGLVAGLIGAVAAAVYLGLTAVSILVAARATAGDPGSPLFFGIVLGFWIVKLVLFLILAINLRGAPWLDPYVFFGTIIVAVLGSLVLDVLAFQRSRVPYASDVHLPEGGDGEGGIP